MNKKKIIQIVFIVLTFGGSGYVLYNGFFNKSSSSIPQTLNGTAGSAPEVPTSPISQGAANSILPYGGQKFDFGILKTQNLQYDAVDYPVLEKSEVGIYDKNTRTFTQPLIK